MNHSVLTGYICQPARLYQTEDGESTTEFTLAVRRRFTKETDYIICVARGALAERIVAKTNRGDKIGVVGSIETPSYVDEYGEKHYRVYVKVSEVDFPPVKKEDKTFVQECMEGMGG